MPIEDYGGHELHTAEDKSGTALDVVEDYAGNLIPLSSPTPGGKPWAGKKWVPIGDSLSDLTLLGNAERPATYKYQQMIADLLPEMTVINYTASGDKRFANGGAGYCMGVRYYDLAALVPPDTDVVTLLGSVNDWKYRSLPGTKPPNALCKLNNRTNSADPSNGSVSWAVDPHLDAPGDNTLAGLVNGTFERIHTIAPRAKVIVITPPKYCGAGTAYLENACAIYEMCVKGWREELGASDWLYCHSTMLLPNLTRAVDADGRITYTRHDSYLNDTEILDTVLEGNLGLPMNSMKIVPSEYAKTMKSGNDYDFAYHYCYDYSVGSAKYGHWTNDYHQKYFAPHIAHWICEALAPSMSADDIDSALPQVLRYNGRRSE